MALSYKARRRWALVILIVGLPVYILCAWIGVAVLYAYIEQPPFWIEFVIYVALGILWAFPFKSIFKGIGQADPDADQD